MSTEGSKMSIKGKLDPLLIDIVHY